MKQGNFILLKDTAGRNWEISIQNSARKVLKTLNLVEFENAAEKILGEIVVDSSDDIISPRYSYFYYGFYVNCIFHYEDKNTYCCDLHNGNHTSAYTPDRRYYQLLRNLNVKIDDFKKGLYKGDYESLVRDVMRYKGRAEFYNEYPIFYSLTDAYNIRTIGRIDCFGNSTHSNLINLFNHMVKVFGWTNTVKDMIDDHSIFGRAYVNAMEATALRFYDNDNKRFADPIYVTPNEETILSHFRKLLIREQYNGKNIDARIRNKYLIN